MGHRCTGGFGLLLVMSAKNAETPSMTSCSGLAAFVAIAGE